MANDNGKMLDGLFEQLEQEFPEKFKASDFVSQIVATFSVVAGPGEFQLVVNRAADRLRETYTSEPQEELASQPD